MLKSAARTRKEHQLCSICGLNGFSDLDLYLTVDVVLDFFQCFSSLVICLFKCCCRRQRRLSVSPERNLKFSHLAWITSCELIENPTESFPVLCPTSAVHCYTSKEKEFPKTWKHSQEHTAGLLILLYTCETLLPLHIKGRMGQAVSLWVHFCNQCLWILMKQKGSEILFVQSSKYILNQLGYMGWATPFKHTQNPAGSWSRM